jgi:hypothetical protein
MRRALLSLLFVSFSACAGYEAAPVGPIAVRSMDAPMSGAAMEGGGATDVSASVTAPKIIRTGDLSVVVDDYATFSRDLSRWLAEAGGYVADTRVDHVDGAVSYANLTLRVPAERFDGLVGWAEERVRVEQIHLERADVTEGWVDVTSRLANDRRAEQRLVELLANDTGSLADVLAVERELARVRGEIEAAEGRLRVLDDQIAMSTLRVSVRVATPYAALVGDPLSARVVRTFGGSVEVMGLFAEGALLAAVAVAPWLVGPALVVGALVIVARRRRRARV